MTKENWTAVRGKILCFTGNPFHDPVTDCVTQIDDGILLMKDGRITACGTAGDILPQIPDPVNIDHYPDGIIMPGFIDGHVHYPQVQIMGAHGKQLLDWLNDYTYPAELSYGDPTHARINAEFFCDELLRNGTTTAASFCTTHPVATDALFTAATARDMAMIAGKVMMDRNAPEAMLDRPQVAHEQCRILIDRWHGRGRNLYAITPRFAPSCTPELLEVAQSLRQEFPDVYVQSHLSETADEIDWVRRLYPEQDGYLAIYDHYGLCGPRSLMGHGIHLTDDEWHSLGRQQTTLVHCPTSNMFLGSGLFDLARAQSHAVPVAIGSDVGAGTSLSLITTLGEAYKVAQLRGNSLTAYQGFYLITLGAARALHLDDRIGSFEVGKMGDLVVLDPNATALLRHRTAYANSMEEILFILMTMGDDRVVKATYTAGRKHELR
ncbi:Guanine deaminase [hydrothermal vent metagenome]|uniref:guanine deaminase n=1 Tax=hydrothermal vent metagenome TaxID=652676 RepID=A0A3B0SGD0_9ZZZZ